MPLFMCRKCGCIDNTATAGGYWYARAYNKPEDMVCSECGQGEWHGQFPKRSAVGMLVDQDGHLWGKEENVPITYRIIGAVLHSGCYSEPGALECQPSNQGNENGLTG